MAFRISLLGLAERPGEELPVQGNGRFDCGDNTIQVDHVVGVGEKISVRGKSGPYDL